MQISDPVADMLARIKNAQQRGREEVSIPHANILVGIAKILKKRGFIENFHVEEQKPQSNLQIELKYLEDDTPAITDAKRMSRPGVRMYRGYRDVYPVRNGFGVGIYSTSQGIKDNEQVSREKIGGEYICKVW